ncbi:SMP-30/gluconolactonase/LRE family protein [Qingshengfaniella alkalisoli]|uniref:SMP-30/gluconolactonase/LRE family protein n=1 Tax=Qingshengfaniella alkalisoli TaxID=2599296 RepID=A0A5B8J0X3_9RHOB|nr:SMP-30/gluconolactonase/LRE family protein [Qingshengfaniella alkalisoli]QDY71544.1 SMP-30/gluconolactonase/LRE family protein [Qingshengfaniella alkalisoli]
MKPTVDCIIDTKAKVGEGAIWSTRRQALYWVDIPAGMLHRHIPETSRNEEWSFGRPLGCVAETSSGKLVGALNDGFHLFDTDSGAETRVAGPSPAKVGHRFNDGTVDPRGRFLAGTMFWSDDAPKDQGALYSFDGKGDAREIMGGFRTVNGLAFSPDGRIAYVSDSNPDIRTIWAYDYDLDDGHWHNKRVFFDTREVPGRPDGGAIDAEGCYWMAGVSGWQLVRITPDGKVDMQIPMPVEKPTRIAFGGTDLSTLFVTSIHVEHDDAQPQSGGVFALNVSGIKGIPMPVMPGL